MGYAPFGIQNIDGNLIVTYAKQNAVKHDDVSGAGHGFVDAFDTDGHLLQRLATRGGLNSPWGVARASFGFGKFAGDLLIGNFGNGWINALTPTGLVLLDDANGGPLFIDGLWTLTLGGGAKSSPSTLYYTAGPNGEWTAASARSPRPSDGVYASGGRRRPPAVAVPRNRRPIAIRYIGRPGLASRNGVLIHRCRRPSTSARRGSAERRSR